MVLFVDIYKIVIDCCTKMLIMVKYYRAFKKHMKEILRNENLKTYSCHSIKLFDAAYGLACFGRVR